MSLFRFRGSAVRELKKKSGLIGEVYGQAHLGNISTADLRNVLHNPEVRTDLQHAYVVAAAKVGETRALRAAMSAARVMAETHARQRRSGGLGDTPRAAAHAVQEILAGPADARLR